METTTTVQKNGTDKQFYTIKSIFIASFLGGPFVGLYMTSKNFTHLGKKDYASRTLIWGTIATLLILGALAFTPATIVNKIPTPVFPVLYAALITTIAEKFQKEAIQEYLQNGATKQSLWKIIGLSVISLISTVAYIVLLAVFFQLVMAMLFSH
ncbi:MAG: hypothetical protein WCP97_01480 [bacterium]